MSRDDNNQKPTPPPWATMASQEPAAKPWWSDPKTIAPLVLLTVILGVVVFWLPSQVSEPAAKQDSQPSTAESATAPAANTTPLESPWTEAQLAKQRREAQDILARLLDKQRTLEQSQVDQWAQSEFEQALALATTGDELYRNRQFQQAKESYLKAEQQLQSLIDKSDSVFEENLAAGKQALADHDAEKAQTTLALARAINPNHRQAQALFMRAENLNDVLDLVKQSDQAIQLGEYTKAKQLLNEAQSLDSKSTLVQQKQSTLNGIMRDRNFAEAMSAGYSALQANRYDQAINAFNRALAVKPNAVDAKSALTQAQNGKTQSIIQRHMQAAEQAAMQEDWQQAVNEYDQALKVDASLVEAKIERLKANTRLQLDQQLSQYIEQPKRLADQQVYSAAQKTLADARSIANPGPRLQQQTVALSEALAIARTPIRIEIVSDNKTQVTLYRVGQLGSFENHFIDLTPGEYTLVGSRAGYRDVRKEFTVEANTEQTVIQIQCREKIANG